MEMISAVKMRKAVANVTASRAYARLAWEMLNDIAAKTSIKRHPLLAKRPVKKIGLVFVTSNRGLAGGFSSKLLATAHDFIEQNRKELGAETEVVLSGRRGQKIWHRYGHTVTAEFVKIDLTTKIEEILPMAQLMINDYMAAKYDRVVMAYTDFVSPLKQEPRLKQLLPIERPTNEPTKREDATIAFKFEPNPAKVLNALLPRLVEMQIYQAILESDASEHSARMLAMANATTAANDMINELTYSYNKARQAAITQEISEIVGGAAALE